jgi:2,3-bisphosphoglycerate-dependent phosphoglycerate mutase
MPPMQIRLVRHGESEGNVDRGVYLHKPDHALELSSRGVTQAFQCGRDLAEISYQPQRIWMSPYRRTRQTAASIIDGAEWDRKDLDIRESIHLVEQQFGLFDGHLDEDLPKLFPAEHAHYRKAEQFEGRFWARMPLGESRFDVCQRVHQFFGTIQRDAERHGIERIMVVSHGVTIRAFVMMWCHKPWEWFEAERNPLNAEVVEIEGGTYKGSLLWPSHATDEKSRVEEA